MDQAGLRGQPPTGGGPAGAVAAADAALEALAAIDVANLPADEALRVAERAQALSAAALAVEAEALMQLCRTYPFLPRGTEWAERRRAAADEVQAGFGWSQAATLKRLVLAEQLCELPALLAALQQGHVDVPRALLLCDKVAVLEHAVDRRTVAEVVLAAHAKAQPGGLTTRQWAVLVARTIAALDPDAAERRQRRTNAERGVRLHQPSAPGEAAALVLSGPAEQAAAAEAAVDALARAWQAAGRPGTLEQLRYDAAIALLTGAPGDESADTERPHDDSTDADSIDADNADAGNTDAGNTDAGNTDAGNAEQAQCRCGQPLPPAVPRVSVAVNLSMSLSTLLGADDGPCELDRAGMIPPEVARRLAASAKVWRRILTDPVDGHVVTQQIKTYRPSGPMRRFVLARANGACAARGCGHRSGLQLDHVVRFPEGPTSATNLAPLHQRHHDNKSKGGWSHRLDPETGTLTQTSPLGREHATTPLPPPGAVDLAGGPPTCPGCGAVLCPDCGAPDCPEGVPIMQRKPGCPDCTPALHPGDRPAGWTLADQTRFIQLTRELIADTDYELIGRLNAEYLAELNGHDPPTGTAEDAGRAGPADHDP